jgi:hypothetical protein
MTTITLELPKTLVEQIQEKHVDQKEVEAIAFGALEIWLAQKEQPANIEIDRSKRFAESALPFIRNLIEQNRELFETLAQR